MDKEEIIENCLKEFGYLNNPRINILFAKKCIEQIEQNFIKIIEEYPADRENERFMKEILLSKFKNKT
jgi:hypothetical protein